MNPPLWSSFLKRLGIEQPYEHGTMTFQTLVETMAGHDLNHLGQIKSLETTLIR